MIERQTPRKNYDSKIVEHMANVIHNREPNPQNDLEESHVHSYETQSARVNGWELGGQIVCSP